MYAPMDRSQIPGFPNPTPHVDWFTNLPIFKNEKEDDATLNLVRFHVHVCRLRVEFHKDYLMELFMATL